MLELFFEKTGQVISLTEQEKEICKSYFVHKKMLKRQFLLQQGEVCDFTAFVEKGALRAFTVDEKGHEYILQFAFEGWWMSDLWSRNTNEPSIYHIEAIEDTDVQLLTRKAQDEMTEKVPKLERFFRIKFQNACASLQRRMTLNISENTAGKYKALVKSYPNIVQRVPQHMIASYLGVSPEALSRVRKQILDIAL